MSSRDNKKVLLITPSIDMGGMQRAMSNLANGLAGRGIPVEMYALYKNSHFYVLDRSIQFSEPSTEPANQNPATRLISVIREIRRHVKHSEADTVVSYGRYYSSLVMLASLGLGKRIFISDRASPDYRDPQFANIITNLICKFIRPTGIIAQTGVSAEYQKKRFGTNVNLKVIPNAVRDIKIIPATKERIVLAVGRFGDPLKGFDRLIEAWGMVKRKDWRLVFAGGTEQEAPEYGERARQLGIYDSIDFLGKVDDIDSWYARSSIFVIPSRSEGFPNALAEAMCAGLCCVAFDFKAGPRDMIKDNINGIIVPDGDCKAMADKISQLIEHEEYRNRLGKEAVKLQEKLSQERITDKIVNFIFDRYE